MRRKGVILTLILLLPILIMVAGRTASAVVGVKGTKHDLSTGGSGPIKASPGGPSEICVFCHTPHNANPNLSGIAPLWNKSFDPTNNPGYTQYTSDVLTALGYPAAEAPVQTGSKTVHIRTRLCLSCHDGTIALGNLANLPNGFSSNITMNGTAGTTDVPYAMPHEAAGYLGKDLRDDHPVAIRYVQGNPPGADPELYPSPQGGNLKVFADGPNNYVECTSCHDPHDSSNGYFLVEKNTNSQICTHCHNKTGFTGSIHDTSNQLYQPTDGAGGSIGNNVGLVKCMNCHFPHKAGVEDSNKANPVPAQGVYLLSYKEEQSCYNTNLDRWNTGGSSGACHGSGGVVNIYSEVTKNSAHKVGDNSRIGLHQATEAQQQVVGGWSPTQWHVECQDCHNPHIAKNTNHIANGQRGTINGNAVNPSSPLYGTGGTSVLFWPGWPPPSLGSYSPIPPAGVTNNAVTTVLYEYEICLKCHSDFAWGITPPIGGYTNQAMEFNTSNVSYHPVVQSTTAVGNNHQPSPPRGTLGGTWPNLTLGNQTMYCSDCHTKEGDALPTGPHGSTNPNYILRTPFTDMYGNRGTGFAGKQPGAGTDLCMDCHDPLVYWTTANNQAANGATGFATTGNKNLHTQHAWGAENPTIPSLSPWPYRCVNCHSKIPHGFNRKAMVVTNSDPIAYVDQSQGGGKITAVPNLPTGLYNPTRTVDCSSVANGCHQAGP